MNVPSRIIDGRYEYEIEPGRWVSRQRVNQLRDKQAHRARAAVRRAINRGDMKRGWCAECGAWPTEAHHDDYEKPLEVRWLCRSHHVALQRRQKGHHSAIDSATQSVMLDRVT